MMQLTIQAVLAGSLCVGTAMTTGTQTHYADEVITYEPGFSGSRTPRNNDAKRALGKPAFHSNDVSLGHGGLLEVAFVEHVLSNSGDARADLRIVEVGPDQEDVFVALMPADQHTSDVIGGHCRDQLKPLGDGFCEIGLVKGGITSVDIDVFFPGFKQGELRFNAVQVVDDASQGDRKARGTEGADIDAIEALENAPASIWPYAAPVVSVPAQGTTTGTTQTGAPSVKLPQAPVAPVVTVPVVKVPVVGVTTR